MTVYGVVVERDLPADDRRIGGEAATPQTIAEDDDLRPVILIVCGREVAAQSGRNAKRAEICRADLLPVDALRFAVADHRRLPRLHHRQRLKRTRALAEPLKCSEGRIERRAFASALPHHHDSARLGIGQRPKQNRIHRAEDRRARSDTERQHGRGHDGEAGILLPLPQAIANIVQQAFQRRHGGALAIGLLRLLHSTELQHGFATRFLRRHARAQIVFNLHLHVAFEFAGELLLAPAAGPQTGHSQQQRAHSLHACSVPGARKRASIDVVCSHSRASRSSCLRPARVRR